MPITLIATLPASLAVALFFYPRRSARCSAAPRRCRMDDRARDSGLYMRTVHRALASSGLDLAARLDAADRRADGLCKARQRRRVLPESRAGLRASRHPMRAGNLSLDEKDRLVRTVEERGCAEYGGLTTVYIPRRRAAHAKSNELGEDTIGVIQFEVCRLARARAGA